MNIYRTYIIAMVTICIATAQAQNLQPTGTHSWRDTVADRNVHAMGNAVPINYYESDEWARINSRWEVVNDSTWKVDRGNHKVYATEGGRAYYVKPHGGVRHALGTETVRLIKFNRLDSTWSTLFTPTIDSVTIQQGVDELDPSSLTFHDIFPGVDKTLIYSRGRYRERYTFHQEARDTLGNHTPWADHWLGTATLLDIDSLNLTMHDSVGQFTPGVAGRIMQGWLRFKKTGQTVFALSREHLWTSDVTINKSDDIIGDDTIRYVGGSDVVVHKRIVVIGGQPYLIELFDPVSTNSWADGDIWHDAGFGDEGEGASEFNIEGQFNTLVGTAATSGTGDSIKCYLVCSDESKGIRFALYSWPGPSGTLDFIDSTEHGTATVTTAWYYLEFINAPSITGSTKYAIAANGEPGTGSLALLHSSGAGAADTITGGPALIYSNQWGASVTPDSRISAWDKSAYCYYTEGGPTLRVMVLK